MSYEARVGPTSHPAEGNDAKLSRLRQGGGPGRVISGGFAWRAMLYENERKPAETIHLNGKTRNSNCGFKYVITQLSGERGFHNTLELFR